MKNVVILFLSVFLLYSCKNEETFTGDAPNFVLNVETSQLEPVPGTYMYIRGVAQASNSLESVRIKIEDWELDKTITMKSDDIKTYDVDYKFMAPDDVDSEKNAEINVMVTDKAGLQTQYQFFASATGDSSAPEIFANKNIRLQLPEFYEVVSTGATTDFNLEFDAVDEKMLKEISVVCEDINYSKQISVHAMDYHFVDKLSLTESKQYIIGITATDNDGNKVKKELSVMLGLKDYDVMYFADVNTDEELNSDLYGIPMEAVKEGNYIFSATYYNRNANTEVRFLTDETTFTQTTFGLDEKGKLTSGSNTTDVKPVVLPKANQYYKVTLNLIDMTVTAKEVTPPADKYASTVIGLLRGATGWTADKVTWAPANKDVMTKYDENTYLMYIDLEVSAANNNLAFTFTANAWNPYFYFRSAQEPDIIVPMKEGAHANYPYSITQNTTYRFYLDTYASRSWAVPVSASNGE